MLWCNILTVTPTVSLILIDRHSFNGNLSYIRAEKYLMTFKNVSEDSSHHMIAAFTKWELRSEDFTEDLPESFLRQHPLCAGVMQTETELCCTMCSHQRAAFTLKIQGKLVNIHTECSYSCDNE